MKKSEVIELLKDFSEDLDIDSTLLDKLQKSESKPNPAPNPEPKKDVKSDSIVSMTAAEFMQLIEKMTPKKEEPKKEDDDGEIYL